MHEFIACECGTNTNTMFNLHIRLEDELGGWILVQCSVIEIDMIGIAKIKADKSLNSGGKQ